MEAHDPMPLFRYFAFRERVHCFSCTSCTLAMAHVLPPIHFLGSVHEHSD